VACYAAALAVEVFTAFRVGDREQARSLQQRLQPLDKEIVGKLGPAGIKAAMDLVGLEGGPVRPPLAPLAPADRERIATLVAGERLAVAAR
jgi:4-hydroxy-2-oxoglutarate aldolase